MAGTTPYAAGGHTVAGGQERGFYLTDAERSGSRQPGDQASNLSPAGHSNKWPSSYHLAFEKESSHMKKRMLLVVTSTCLILVLGFVVSDSSSEELDPLKLRLRLTSSCLKTNCSRDRIQGSRRRHEPKHSHPHGLTVYLANFESEVKTFPDGKRQGPPTVWDGDLERGDCPRSKEYRQSGWSCPAH